VAAPPRKNPNGGPSPPAPGAAGVGVPATGESKGGCGGNARPEGAKAYPAKEWGSRYRPPARSSADLATDRARNSIETERIDAPFYVAAKWVDRPSKPAAGPRPNFKRAAPLPLGFRRRLRESISGSLQPARAEC